MIDREKVIRGMECCLASKYPPCGECGYDGDMKYNDPWSCRLSLMADALVLLKAQEPRVTCSVCKYSRCLSGEWFCFMIGTSRYGKRVTDGDWYCKDAIGR